jgi:hypothetical protein
MMCVASILTAAFLFAQFSVQPQRALLVLASGFVSSGLFARGRSRCFCET